VEKITGNFPKITLNLIVVFDLYISQANKIRSI